MKFRFYITDICNGCIRGTNSVEDSETFAACEDYFVVDTETGEWVNFGGRSPIEPIN
jgi:hypothetical protein